MIAMLNPQPLPPRADPPSIANADLATPGLITPIAPKGGCPTCTSGRFLSWEHAVDGHSVTLGVTVPTVS